MRTLHPKAQGSFLFLPMVAGEKIKYDKMVRFHALQLYGAFYSLSLYRSILRLAVFGKFGDATRPDDHTSPRAHARSSAAASPHPDAVLTRLAAQRSNVLELHSALTTADGHTARRSKLVEHGGARSWE